ncbi:hypothetical protein AB1A81_00040 [Bdellovibrio bacteriovorus]|uniref:Uncharacterized protein n=1 Tax=Bdellovibrio bacteriovorus (strain ATCC 15356 / DSM 50701 / NCIMB 9529 / HD100) TaxID=264462 RepID=Q6MRR4_BDEBA|nr:hypothetical protein [Bdellovibrio bacteriovorus]AHZ85669.1 hypothetical protein EP01_12080 [Bdellovibrio bacteriovorus]BEV66588.1 hypothetical protein Bb109J_c0008 [Bdellovibrio bacteriovorus]CAE77692.1 hypothetical protein predicted by Glimmer/Critica [Bdellovibrio bacteriovorus HD100]
MKYVLAIQALTTLLGGVLLGFFAAPQHTYSFISGALVILVSFFLMGWAWGLIFSKKLVALAIGIIVFKYAILGIIIFKLVDQTWFDTLWFALGVASFILSALGYAVKEALREGKEDVI